jgi:hypothetical protein
MVRFSPAPSPERLTVWPPARFGVAGLAVLTAGGTVVVAVVAGPSWAAFVGGLHVAATLLTVVQPSAVPAQVAAGMVLCWGLLADAGDAPLGSGPTVALVALVVGVVVTAELLGLAAQMGIVVARHPGDGLARVGVAAAVSLVATGGTLAIGRLDGPEGVVATLLAVAGGVGLAALLLHGNGPADRTDRPSG